MALVVARCDASEVFDPVEEPLHEVSLPVDPAGEREASLSACLRRDIGPSPSRGRLRPDGIAVIALVGQQDVAFAEVFRKRISLGAVGDLTAGQA